MQALKIEDLNMTTKTADKIETVLKSFLLNLDFPEEKIEPLDCRSRDGFSPYSHNKGGFDGTCFNSQYSCYLEGTGFENTDKTLSEYHQYEEKQALEEFCEEKSLTQKYVLSSEELTEEYYEYENEYMCSDDQSTVIFSCALMVTSENTLNIRVTIGAKDAPYHRQYDDLIELDILFINSKDLEKKLNRILKINSFELLTNNLTECY